MNQFYKFVLSRRNLLKASLLGLLPASAASAATLSVSYKIELPTQSTSAQIRVSTNQTIKGYVEYGYTKGKYIFKSTTTTLKTGNSSVIVLNGLKPKTTVYFRLRYALNTSGVFLAKTGASFVTAEVASNSTFAVQADPHMDENSDATVYTKTLEQVVAAAPAFLMDLGDIFMVDKLKDKSEANIRARFELMKGFYNKLGSVPLKICLGNHDGELGYSQFNTKKYRAEYFPEQTRDLAYFSLTGPDQLHIVLDPFTYTTVNPKVDGWQWTLGKTQYDWLISTLQNSKERFKFVYIHHLLVGDAQSRGGVEIAMRNEWGGNNVDGSYGFDTQRPAWGKPIHLLLKEYGVAIVFKGHDHLYVKQELDGIIYQTVPQPSHPGDKINVSQYGYLSGKGVGGSGFIKVRTEANSCYVDFVKFDGSIGDSYTKVVN